MQDKDSRESFLIWDELRDDEVGVFERAVEWEPNPMGTTAQDLLRDFLKSPKGVQRL